MMKDWRALVTGGAGFVGSNLVKRLCELGASVTVLDDLTTGTLDNLRGLQYRLVRGSVFDANATSALVKESDIVFHLATRCLIASTSNPRSDLEVNIGGTLNVLLAASEHGVKVIYTSSVSVYGNQIIIPTPENATPDLLSPYAVSKYAGEGYCHALAETSELDYVILRLSNVYGRNQNPASPYCGVVSKFMDAVARGQPVRICGDGLQTRDFTYIDDAIDAIILAATVARASRDTLNIGSGIETSINTLADFIIGLNGSYLQPQWIERRDIDNVYRRAVNIDRARHVLGWKPKTSLKQGLLRTWEWFHG